ncbi:glycosyl transferase family 1 [Bifidobacterium ramosum]|uniref:Glycosyl transferase family 1 n=1 Tax=Bifidobacterium ramosum TaxID=1798158 RepID=A0A6L4WYR7_9BIFI|nr:glycosyltransferase [Bifidobacterium ramosum]KAB8287248.1 glycosyl transferase family 1 [Bifidobacterium ramosum]NEG71959.1 glycosyltransferase [Bifidobacterium ramosum]
MEYNQIRVLEVVPSLSRAAGVARFAYNMALYHDEQRVHYDFLHHAIINGQMMHEKTYDQDLLQRGSKVYTVNYAGAGFLRFVKEVGAFFKQHGSEYDIVHCQMPNSAFCVLRDAKKAGIKHRVLHSHLNNSSDKFLHRVRNMPLNAIGKLYATDRLACSEDAGRFLFGNKPFTVIRNGIPIEQFAYNPDRSNRLRAELGIGLDDPVIGCVGRMVKQKNYPFAVKVFAQFLNRRPDAKLVFIGDGTDRAELEQVIHDEGVAASVLLLGVREDIDQLYSMFDVFFMPSLYEGLPVSCVEAQAAGLPCVYSMDVPHESDITGTGTFVDRSADLSEWVKALDQASQENRLVQNPRLLAERGYSVKDNAEVLMQYYEHLMADGQ